MFAGKSRANLASNHLELGCAPRSVMYPLPSLRKLSLVGPKPDRVASNEQLFVGVWSSFSGENGSFLGGVPILRFFSYDSGGIANQDEKKGPGDPMGVVNSCEVSPDQGFWSWSV